VGVTKGTSSIVYAYSGLGDRLKQIADGVTTDYTLDINAGLTQVLQDGKQTYLYGNSCIAQIAETQTGYFLPDALGSMRQMTDSSADLTLAKSYDPYGNVISSSGAGETVYGYTSEMQSGGLVHLRARDYVAQLGRFTTMDTWEGNSTQPTTLNKWLYVGANPVINSDPSGLCQHAQGGGWNDQPGGVFSKENCDMLETTWQDYQIGHGKPSDLDKMKAWYFRVADWAKEHGANQASTNLRHFLDGTGTPLQLDKSFMEKDIWGWKYVQNKVNDIASWYVQSKDNSCDYSYLEPEIFWKQIEVSRNNKEIYLNMPTLDEGGSLASFRLDVEINGFSQRKPNHYGNYNYKANLAVHLVAFDRYDWHEEQDAPIVESVSLFNLAFNKNTVSDDWALLLEKHGLGKSFFIRGDTTQRIEPMIVGNRPIQSTPPDDWTHINNFGE
jgi:RHS repeat-associated protein